MTCNAQPVKDRLLTDKLKVPWSCMQVWPCSAAYKRAALADGRQDNCCNCCHVDARHLDGQLPALRSLIFSFLLPHGNQTITLQSFLCSFMNRLHLSKGGTDELVGTNCDILEGVVSRSELTLSVPCIDSFQHGVVSLLGLTLSVPKQGSSTAWVICL